MQHFYTDMFSPIAQSIKHSNVNHFNPPKPNSQFDNLIRKGRSRKLFIKPSNPFKKRSKVQHNSNKLNDQNIKLLTDEYDIIMDETDASFQHEQSLLLPVPKSSLPVPQRLAPNYPNTNYSYLHRNHTPYLKQKISPV